jgi:hypothetical protein
MIHNMTTCDQTWWYMSSILVLYLGSYDCVMLVAVLQTVLMIMILIVPLATTGHTRDYVTGHAKDCATGHANECACQYPD